jgi:hypothetical protein
MIDYEDDMNEIFSEDDFGIVFTYNSVEYNGILTELFYEEDIETAGVGGSQPVLYTTIEIPRNTVLTLDGDDYEVIQCQPNKRNMVMVILHAL